ncbi:DUF1289 domain-containing protein [Gayadomonas joobiniege]|uniref:DUF1289 domain-containing protein n=1 Tax=Gayadomonas joobiniege TaxID=1234606 RepID=UPI00037205FF|nr:DUF1289 domain-containing protein [Gayadomonas joobiniege]
MRQTRLFEEEIESPCIGVCESGKRGYCKGCLRSREERYYWPKLNNEQKIQVVRLCKMRKNRLNNKIIKEREEALLKSIQMQQLDLF